MPIREIKPITEKKALLAAVATRVPAILNYHDLMLSMNDPQWSSYRVFTPTEDSLVFAGLSPEGNLNVYGTNDEEISQLADNILSKHVNTRVPFFRGNALALTAIARNAQLQAKLTELNLITCLRYRVKPMKTNQQFNIRRAQSNLLDHQCIQQWYEAYNQELGMNYSVPCVSEIENRNFYLLHDENNQFIGAYANTLQGGSRFWIGRFYIFSPHRRQGIGSLFFHKIVESIASHYSEIHLHVNTRNPSAIAFYEKLGFEQIGMAFYAKYTI